MSNIEKLAGLLKALTYDEMMEVADFMSSAAQDWAIGESIKALDAPYFAGLLSSFAEHVREEAEAAEADA